MSQRMPPVQYIMTGVSSGRPCSGAGTSPPRAPVGVWLKCPCPSVRNNFALQVLSSPGSLQVRCNLTACPWVARAAVPALHRASPCLRLIVIVLRTSARLGTPGVCSLSACSKCGTPVTTYPWVIRATIGISSPRAASDVWGNGHDSNSASTTCPDTLTGCPELLMLAVNGYRLPHGDVALLHGQRGVFAGRKEGLAITLLGCFAQGV